MKNFFDLLALTDKLLGPGGCPWDQDQTINSLEPCLLEEAHEVLEAIDNEEYDKVLQELGDLFHVIIFMAKIAQKEGLFTIEDVIDSLYQKLYRRHPHIFGNERLSSSQEVVKKWDEIKATEKEHLSRKSVLDGIPHNLPPLLRAQKIIKKMIKKRFNTIPASKKSYQQDEIGKKLFEWLIKSELSGIDAHKALRIYLKKEEKNFRAFEQKNAGDELQT